jgi:hypothetical protein
MLTSSWKIEQSTSGVINKPIQVNHHSQSSCGLHLELEPTNQFPCAVPFEETSVQCQQMREELEQAGEMFHLAAG